MMNTVTVRRLAMMFAAVLLVFATACSSSNNGKADTGDASAGGEGPFGKYDSPITITTVRDTDASMAFKPGEDWENNAYSNAYLEELGIGVKYDWIVPSDQYDAKLNIAISSGNLPDFFKVNAAQLSQLVEADLVADLTDVYEKYASDITRKSIELGPLSKASATFDGKLMALSPDQDGYEGKLQMMWIRTDWLDKLGLSVPATFAELENVIRAFKEDDPDGNGKDDTYGIGLTKDIYTGGVGEATSIFGAFHAWPSIWVEDDNGQLVYGGVQPEIREALLKLQEWYKKGYIDREFGVKDGGKLGEDATAGKLGLEFGALWNSLWPLQDNVSNDTKADWMPVANVSVDSTPPQYQADLNFDSYYVVRKGYKHPEALIKLVNLSNEKLFGESADAIKYHTEIFEGKEYGHFKERAVQDVGNNPVGGNMGHYKKVTAALDSKDPSGLNAEQKGYYDKIVAFQNGDRASWGTVRVFGHESSHKLIEQLYENKEHNIKFTKFFGAPTPTMVEKKATLDKLQLETYTKIILGDPIESFDKFVQDWNNAGGAAMTKEVNDWYSKQ